jgi:hypothetical protein
MTPEQSEKVRAIMRRRRVRLAIAARPPRPERTLEERIAIARDRRAARMMPEACATDYARACEVLALMSPEERARWSAPDPVQDAAAEMEREARGVLESMRR